MISITHFIDLYGRQLTVYNAKLDDFESSLSLLRLHNDYCLLHSKATVDAPITEYVLLTKVVTGEAVAQGKLQVLPTLWRAKLANSEWPWEPLDGTPYSHLVHELLVAQERTLVEDVWKAFAGGTLRVGPWANIILNSHDLLRLLQDKGVEVRVVSA